MTIEELSARLEKVERANRRLRAGGLAALVLAAAGAAMGQAIPAEKVVRAESIQVVDKDGKVRSGAWEPRCPSRRAWRTGGPSTPSPLSCTR
jgi:hypothetical protein